MWMLRAARLWQQWRERRRGLLERRQARGPVGARLHGLTLGESLAYRAARRIFWRLTTSKRPLTPAQKWLRRKACGVYSHLLNKRDGFTVRPPERSRA